MSKLTRILLVFLVVIMGFAGIFYFITDRLARHIYPLEYSDIVEHYAEKYHVEKALVYAVINVESGFRKDALSQRGAMGLMQLTPKTYEWALMRDGQKPTKNHDELYNPDINIHYGVYVLSLHLEEFSDIDTALCAYNAGRGAVKNWLSDERYCTDGLTVTNIPYNETKNYVKKVKNALNAYNKLYFKKEN